jgi:hypothetical protein
MDERGANIDIVFRNGFKDYEVLPPPEVWDNIQPVIGKRRSRFIFLRSAAMIILLLSVSFLIYRWNSEAPSGIGIQPLTYNMESIPVVENPPALSEVTPVNATSGSISPVNTFGKVVSVKNKELISEIVSVEINTLSSETNNITISNIADFPGLQKVSLTGASSGTLSPDYVSNNLLSNEIPQVKEKQRWSIAALASPTYYSQFSSGNDAVVKQMIASEQPMISYAGGVALSYKVNRRISVQSGIYYSSFGQEISGISSYSGFRDLQFSKGDNRNFEVLTTSGTIYTNNADIFLIDATGNRVQTQFTSDILDPVKASLPSINNSLKQNFSYLELPVVLKYKVIDRSLDINVIGGVSYNFLLSNSVYAINDGSKYPVGKTDELNMMTFSSSIGMGMEYNFSRKVSMNLEPTFRYYLNPFNDMPGSSIHPYSFGIFSGFSYKF